MSIYREVLLDHYKHPRNYGSLEDADFTFTDSNPLCGDVVTWSVKLEDGKVRAAFTSEGCAVSKAAASMVSELVQGRKPEEVLRIGREDLLQLLGVNLSVARVKCALLGLKALQKALVKMKAEEAEKWKG